MTSDKLIERVRLNLDFQNYGPITYTINIEPYDKNEVFRLMGEILKDMDLLNIQNLYYFLNAVYLRLPAIIDGKTTLHSEVTRLGEHSFLEVWIESYSSSLIKIINEKIFQG